MNQLSSNFINLVLSWMRSCVPKSSLFNKISVYNKSEFRRRYIWKLYPHLKRLQPIFVEIVLGPINWTCKVLPYSDNKFCLLFAYINTWADGQAAICKSVQNVTLYRLPKGTIILSRLFCILQTNVHRQNTLFYGVTWVS